MGLFRKRQVVFESLQKLTNVELQLLSDGTVIAVNNDLGEGKELGTSIINELLLPEHQVTIGTSFLTNRNTITDEGGAIQFNVLNWGLSILNEDGSTGRSPEIGLAHELIHIYLGITMSEDELNEMLAEFITDVNTGEYISVFEALTRTMDSEIRGEQEHVLRADPFVLNSNESQLGEFNLPIGGWQDVGVLEIIELYMTDKLQLPEGMTKEELQTIQTNVILGYVSTQDRSTLTHDFDTPEEVIISLQEK